MIPLLQMLEWGQHRDASGPKWEWIEDELPVDRDSGRRRCSNLLQVFDEKNERDRERVIANAAINGQPWCDPNPASKPRMRGAIELIRDGASSTIIDHCGAELDLVMLDFALGDLWECGSTPSALLINRTSLWASSLPRLSRGDPCVAAAARPWAEYSIITSFGHVDVLPTPFVPQRIALLVDSSRMHLVSTNTVPVEATLVMRNAGDGGHALIQNFGPPA